MSDNGIGTPGEFSRKGVDESHRSYKLHATAYVTKPVDLDQFMNAVRQIDEFFVQVVRLP